VLFVGTSLTAGYGLEPDQAFPSLIARMADSAGTPITAVNAGVSGETSADALHRIAWVLRAQADIVVLETGANDGLRALPVDATRANIAAIVDRVKRAKPGVPIVLAQMEVPPNMGEGYFMAFHDMYGDIAREKGVTLLPFLLAGVAGRPDLNQDDGLHPNAVGERIVATNVWRGLQPIIRSIIN
jgi:acyl-CoA thioesterase-1